MARVMVCDDDVVMTNELVLALRAAGHEAETCHHTMDVLRAAAGGRFDLLVIGLDMVGFGRSGAVEAMQELAPRVALIALHKKPSEILRTAARTGVAAVLPRPTTPSDFMYAVTRSLEQAQASRPLATHG